MKTRSFSFILVVLILFSNQSFARWSAHEHCAHSLEDITSEFQKTPDDRHKGLVTHRVPLTTTTMMEAYPLGLFPWFITEMGTAAWFNPPERGVLWLDQIRFSSKEYQFFRNAFKKYHWTMDEAFSDVIRRCAELRKGDTWISDDYLNEYPRLAEKGMAHSIEIWRNDNGKLAGGLYGVDMNGTFTGESIYREPDEPHVDKYALYILAELLKSAGRKWIDTQVRTRLIETVGGVLVPRDEFLSLRAQAEAEALPFPKRTIEISQVPSYH